MAPRVHTGRMIFRYRSILALVWLSAAGVSALGCQRATLSDAGTSTAVRDPVLLARLRAAPLAITISGQTLSLQPLVWRDFMPRTPPDGKPMVATFRVVAADSSRPLTVAIAVDSAWVVNGSLIWAQQVTEVVPPNVRPGGYEAVIGDGPKWGPGIAVDVVARIRLANGTPRLLRASGVTIRRTD